METPQPEHIGPYRVVRRLGSGGMGEVFLAYDPRLDRQVAVKRIRSEGPPDPSRRTRLRREARLAASLQHPAIVQVYDLVTEGETDHIVFELVPGDTLQHLLAKEGSMPLPRALAVAHRLAEGLAFAHSRGVIHRDLKTENVLMTPEGDPKISDFGIARRLIEANVEESLTREGMVMGTYRALAPELLRGQAADHRSDLFSFGVLLYELFTGDSPFLAETGPATAGRILHHRQRPAGDLDEDLPPALSALIDRLLEKEPRLRPQDASEVARQLHALMLSAEEEVDETLALAVVRPGHEPRAPTPRPSTEGSQEASTAGKTRSRRLRWAAAVVLLGALAALATFRLQPAPAPPLLVAVLAPALGDQQGDQKTGEEDRILAFAVRNGLTRTLAALDGIYPKSAREVDAVPGPPTAVARAVAADELILSTLACEGEGCWLEISRVRGEDGGVLWSEALSIARHHPLAAARAAGAHLRVAFRERSVRPGVPDLSVSSEDYAAYLDLERALGSGLGELSVDQAIDRLAEIRRSSPRFLDAYLLAAALEASQLAASRDETTRLERALALIEEAETLAPGDPEVGLRRASVELQAGRLEEAAATLGTLSDRMPGLVTLLDLSADLARRQGQPERALTLSRQAVARRPSWTRLYTHAQLAFEQGQLPEARESLERLLAQVPEYAAAKWLLAWLELTQGDASRAAQLFEEIAEERPYPGSWVNLGLAHMLLGEPEAAAEAIHKAVEAAPGNPLFVLNLADARALEGRLEEAVALYETVIGLLDEAPGTPGWRELSARAQALAHLGKHREAVALSQQALRLAPNDPQAMFEASLVSVLVGDRTAAVVQAERALDLGFQRRFFELPWFNPLRNEPTFVSRLEKDTFGGR